MSEPDTIINPIPPAAMGGDQGAPGLDDALAIHPPDRAFWVESHGDIEGGRNLQPSPASLAKKAGSISQGDIFRYVAVTERVEEDAGRIYVRHVVFPHVIVLSQDCDLDRDFKTRCRAPGQGNQDKMMLSVLVAPLYNADHVMDGSHLQNLGMKMRDISAGSSTARDTLKRNGDARYHYLKFPDGVPLVDSIIDFKHYATVHVEQLSSHATYVWSMPALYRERISQRFTDFLARIGLPEPHPWAKVPYVASLLSDVVHRAGCAAVASIRSGQPKGYDSLADALHEGKTPCRRCLGPAR